jgi:hypothetical protein
MDTAPFPSTDPVIDRFLSLQSQVVRELLPAFADIERYGSKIIITYKTDSWRAFFQKWHYPLEPGRDLKLSIADCVAARGIAQND